MPYSPVQPPSTEPHATFGSAFRARSWWRTPVGLTTFGAILTLVLPVLIFGPWLPLLDLVGFVGMYTYPPQLSYGPLHYYVFQLSYIGVLVVCRLLADLGIASRFQIPIFYLAEVFVCWGVIWLLLRRLITNPWLRCVGVALGTVAFWDGVFLWGGPLAHSLGAACITLATYFAIRGAAEPQAGGGGVVAFFCVAGVTCHPFILPFALVVCGVRFLFDGVRRTQTVLLALVLLVFGWVIFRDSPATEVASAAGGLRLLWGVHPAQILARITDLFTRDTLFASMLFGEPPVFSRATFLVMGVLHVLAFVSAPILAWKDRSSVWIRMSATLVCAAAVLYFFSCELPNSPIGEWPQRVLTLYAPFTFILGVTGPVLVLRHFRSQPFNLSLPRWAWAVPAIILACAFVTHAQVFAFGHKLEAAVANARQQIVASDVTNAHVAVAGLDNVQPFYLRAVPFMLFSDPAVIEKDLLLSTEWHVKARHPTRVAEAMVDLGRSQYLADFSMRGSQVCVRLQPQPASRFAIVERTDANTWITPAWQALNEATLGREAFQHRLYASALKHYNTVIYLEPKGIDAWNDAGATLVQLGRLEDSIRYFNAALQLDPKFALAHQNLAIVLADTGHPKDALAHAEAALQLDPTLQKSRDLATVLENQASHPPGTQ